MPRSETYLAVVTAAVGVFVIAVSLGALPGDPIFILGSLLVILGAGVAGYSSVSKNYAFHITWGSLILLAGLAVLLRNVINPLAFLGIFLVLVSVISLVFRSRGGKHE